VTDEEATELLSELVNAVTRAVHQTNSNRGTKNAYTRQDKLVARVFRELTGGIGPTPAQMRRIVE
jgi:hypothetical protein